MTTRNVEIRDTLEERTETAIENVKSELISYLEQNPTHSMPDMGKLDYSGTIREIIDGAVSIHTREIEDTWYLYAAELEEAYEDAGIGSNPRENNGRTAIFCYIEAKVSEWYAREAETVYDRWQVECAAERADKLSRKTCREILEALGIEDDRAVQFQREVVKANLRDGTLQPHDVPLTAGAEPAN